jgi:hypothetical protein
MLFNALWRAKRMEWILSGMWKQQITSAKLLRKLPGMSSSYVNKNREGVLFFSYQQEMFYSVSAQTNFMSLNISYLQLILNYLLNLSVDHHTKTHASDDVGISWRY